MNILMYWISPITMVQIAVVVLDTLQKDTFGQGVFKTRF